MQIAAFRLFRNLKIRSKLFLLFLVLALLLFNLGAITLTSLRDVQQSTNTISNVLVPRLIETTAIRDDVTEALEHLDVYAETQNTADAAAFERTMDGAVNAVISLFTVAQTDTDFTFAELFQEQLNTLYADARAYEDAITTNAPDTTRSELQRTLAKDATAFDAFFDTEVATALQTRTNQQRSDIQTHITRTTATVAGVACIALILFFVLYILLDKTVTSPIQQLTTTAQLMTQGTFQAVAVDSQDEIGVFAETFNTMAQQIKATQEALQLELEKTQELDRQKTEFVSIAAHQLRTPMSGIKWVVSMAVEGDFGDLPGEAKEHLGEGLENIQRMITLINSLLDVTEIDTDRASFTLSPQLLSDVATPIIDEWQGLLKDHSATVAQPDSTLPLADIDADKFQMALRNVLDNAEKYSPANSAIEIAYGSDAESVWIDVTDHGYGIPEDEQERLFSKFFRGSNIQTIQADGSGLGLFIAHEILDEHDGDIIVTSQTADPSGTTIRLQLPHSDTSLQTSQSESQ